MERITSRKNPLLEHIRRLDSGAYRRQCGAFLCDSPKLVDEALRHGVTVTCVVVSDGVALPESLSAGVRRVCVPADVMASISPHRTPQGLLAVCELPDTAPPAALAPGRKHLAKQVLELAAHLLHAGHGQHLHLRAALFLYFHLHIAIMQVPLTPQGAQRFAGCTIRQGGSG